MTLHEAIDKVIKENGSPMFASDIADVINKGNLYKRSDNSKIPASQITARVNSYLDWFNIDTDGRISRKKDAVNDLLKFAIKTKNKLVNSNSWSFDNWSSNLLITAFFAKYIIDNPKFIDKYFNINILSFSCENITRLYELLGELNTDKSLINGLFNEILGIEEDDDEIEFPFCGMYSNNVYFDDFLYELSQMDLSENYYSKKEFSVFFEELIRKISRVENQENMSSKLIGEIFYEICKTDLSQTCKIYNPASGFSTIAGLFARKSKNTFTFSGNEINKDVYLLSLLNLIVNDINIDNYKLGDTFQLENKDSYDLVFCQPPFGVKYTNSVDNLPVQTNDLTSLYILESVSNLNKAGKAVIIVNEAFLFNNSKSIKNVRNYLLENKLLESVISLPVGVIESTNIKTSILVLSKKNNDKVLFIKADDFKVSRQNKGLDLINFISQSYNNLTTENNQVNEPQAFYGTSKQTTIEISNLSKDNLTVNSYIYEKEILAENTNFLLKDILTEYTFNSEINEEELKFINISDLNKNYTDIYLNTDALEYKRNSKVFKPVDTDVLLIGSIVPNIKPTFLKKENFPILVSNKIYVFSIDTNKVDIEYLIYELNSEYIKKQILSKATGATIPSISKKHLLSIRVNIPSLEEQKKILKIKKEAIYSSKIAEADKIASKLKIEHKKNESQILGFLNHELGNIIAGVSSDITNIKNFIETVNIDLNTSISKRKGAVTLFDVFNRIDSNIKDINNLKSNIKDVIDFGNKKTNKEKVHAKKFIKQEINKLKDDLNNNNVEIIFDEKFDKYIFIDKNQFVFVIRNFIINSIKHGFTDNQSNNRITFKLNSDSDFSYLHMINNGVPFSDDFTIENFITFGDRKNSSGSGIGGYLIGKIIENHEGELDLIEKNPVNFLIKIPKN